MVELYPYQRALERVLGKVDTLEEDTEYIKKWYRYLKTDKNESLSVARIVKMLRNISLCSDRFKERFGKRLIKATKEEITELIIEIQDSDRAELTKRDYNIAIKKYLTFAGKGDQVDWIKTYVSDKKRKLPEDMITEAEVNLLIDKAQNSRDKAMFALLADTGSRIGENWIENHPRPDRDNWLFVTLDKNCGRLVYAAARQTLLDAVAAAGIKKRVHAQLFRHTAATRAASFMTEQEMKIHFGWEPGSKMPAIYVHMDGKQVDNKLLTHYGLKTFEEDGKGTLIKCPKCARLNPITSRFCGNCACIIDAKLMTQSDTIHEKIARVKEYLFQSQESVRDS